MFQPFIQTGFAAEGSKVTQADLDAVEGRVPSVLPPFSYVEDTSVVRPPIAYVRPSQTNRGATLAKRLRDLAAARAKTAKDATSAAPGGVLADARDSALKEVGTLLALTAPAWGTVLLVLLARR